MSVERTVSIYAPAKGRKNYVALDVPVRKLANYSEYAKYRYFPDPNAQKPSGGEGDKRNTSTTEYDLGQDMNEDFARTVAIHIKASDPDNPAPLTLDLFGEHRSLEELVQIWRVIGKGYRCPTERHDDSIRTDLRVKMYKTKPFTFAHFKLIIEELYFDKGLFHAVMDRAAYLHVKDYLDKGTQVEIQKYCQAHPGWFDVLLNMVGNAQDSIAEHEAEKEAREKRAEQQKASAERKAREEEKSKGTNSRGKGKQKGSSKGRAKAKKPVVPFVHKDEDFPPLF